MALGLVVALSLALLPGAADAAGKGKKVGHTLTVMTRNLYLGADLKPIIGASNVNEAVDLAGQAVNQAHATKFPTVRSKLLAKEIQKTRPDVVGLQEVALYRTEPVNFAAVAHPSATQLDPQGGDFLADLLGALNKGNGKGKGKKGSASAAKKKSGAVRYRVAVQKPEFDAEFPVNDNGQGSGLAGADHNERLTYSDVILVKKGVKVSNPTSGTYNTLLRVSAGGVPITVTRGWAAADVKVHGRKVHVVDTHLEAYDDQASNNASDGMTYPKGGIREAQAKQLVGPGGPASQPRTVLVGDLNSDFPVHGDQVSPGDALAYQAVLAGGFSERAITPPPFSCCISDPFLADPSSSGITHRVDHVLTNSKKIRFQKGGLTHTYANGLWSSDHFGVWSTLLIK